MANFEMAMANVSQLGYEPVNPTHLPHDHPDEWAEYMREDLRALTECTAIYLIQGWCDSKGAVLEAKVAKALGLTPIGYAYGWQLL